MSGKLTPEFVIQYTKFATGITFVWPPSSKASRLSEITFKIGWWVSWILCVVIVLSLFRTAYNHRDNFMQLTETLSTAACLLQVMTKMVVGKCHYNRLQYLIHEMETFVENANFHEREILTNYIKRIVSFHFVYHTLCAILATFYIFGPFLMDQPLPFGAEYPFCIDEHPAYDIVYLLESIGGIQCSCIIAFICQVSLLLWYGTIQLAFLAEKMRNVNNTQQLKECISKHQHILRYIDEITKIVRYMVMTAIVVAMISVTCSGIHIVGKENIIRRIQFLLVVIVDGLELLCLAWAAENLSAASKEVGWALYSSTWIKHSKELNKTVIFVIQRCQTPPKIAIGGLLPQLSMNYYGRYMSTMYSFFTTLRVMLKKFEDDV
ncbi:uncharacterized protein LOC114841389 [Diachasma alloeum]|uniref:Odorant receptor n=1 Tax=Diachasma alloeum TaxID=454923 RepID=A0A4E0RT51_9HYME|nr:uncharacterized protein LOC114841389 [Diachasma alloeum]THK33127.1 odorant receptor 63 [Diachasma alloeum]